MVYQTTGTPLDISYPATSVPVLNNGAIVAPTYTPFENEYQITTHLLKSVLQKEEASNQESKNDLLPVLISQNISKGKLCTTVKWNDDTYTVVKLPQGEESSLYTAFCAALAKKLYGTNARIHRMVEACDAKKIEEHKLLRRREEKLKQEAKDADIRKKKIAKLAKEMRLQEEARRMNYCRETDW